MAERSLQPLAEISRLRRRGKTIVFTNGCFDLIHAGHVRFLSQAKSKGDILVVGLNSDPSVRRLKGPRRPVLKLRERLEIMKNLKPVDFVIPFSEATPLNLIKKVNPHVLIKGGDWRESDIVGARWVRDRGGRVIPGIYVNGKSTSAIIRAIRHGR